MDHGQNSMEIVQADSGGQEEGGVPPRVKSSPELSMVLPVLLILILYTLFLQFQPSEPYLVPYLTRVKLFTNSEVNSDIFPVGVYATLFFTLMAAPACHFLSYRPVIILDLEKHKKYVWQAIDILYSFAGKSLLAMQMTQVTYGMGAASDLVFSSYIYLLVPEKYYQRMTSYTQASSVASYMLAAELGQGLVDRSVSLVSLLQITILFVFSAFLVSFFYRRSQMTNGVRKPWSQTYLDLSYNEGVIQKIKETWSGRTVQLLSFWWVLGTAGFAMIPNYGTSLFDDIDALANSNGHVLAASQGAAFIGALGAVKVADEAALVGGLVFVGGSFLVGFLCILMAWSRTLIVTYTMYVGAVGVNQLLLCLVYVQSAKSLSNGQFILLFSLNAVAGLLTQTGIQGAVVFFQLSITKQFYAFGVYCIAVGLAFGILCFANYVRTGLVVLVSPEEDRLVNRRCSVSASCKSERISTNSESLTASLLHLRSALVH